jgi:hypothetical protein
LFKICDFDSDDNIQYQEIVSTTTDLFGMVNVKIGNSLLSDIDSLKI